MESRTRFVIVGALAIIVALIAWLTYRANSAPAGTVEIVDIGFQQDATPMSFALKIANGTSEPVAVNGLQVIHSNKFLLHDDDQGGQVPNSFQFAMHIMGETEDGNLVALAPGDSAPVVPAHGSATVFGAIEWIVPEGAPPLLAIMNAEFAALDADDMPICQSAKCAIVLQSEPGALHAAVASTAATSEAAAAVADHMVTLEGRRSPAFRELLKSVEAIAAGK